MKKQLTNAVYGLLDYASYPLGMLLVAPVILRHLGVAQYGLWMVSTSVVSVGGIIASGFGDAGIQRIAKLRGADKAANVHSVVKSLFILNLMLGFLVTLATWSIGPYAGSRLATMHSLSQSECTVCLRIASVQILLRSLESLGVSVQRALQEYRGTVRISVAMRFLSLAIAALMASVGNTTEIIMVSTTVVLALGTVLQLLRLRGLRSADSLQPSTYKDEMRVLLRNGAFVWLQSAGSIAFRQLDRILLGFVLGASAVTPYALCIQVAEPLFGLTASTMSFFLPYLSGRAADSSARLVRSTVLIAFLCNFAFVSCGAILLLAFGRWFLYAWVGHEEAWRASAILPLIVASSALTGLSVTGTYGVQALGLFREAAFTSLGCRAGLCLLMFYLLRHEGLQGVVFARLLYGAAALLIYIPLIQKLGAFKSSEIILTPRVLVEDTDGGACS